MPITDRAARRADTTARRHIKSQSHMLQLKLGTKAEPGTPPRVWEVGAPTCVLLRGGLMLTGASKHVLY